MDAKKFLQARFDADRPHLKAVAYRMLGSRHEAEDAVQEAWLRLERSDMGDVGNLGGWLTTVVARICLDMLRARKSRREDALDMDAHQDIPASAAGPEEETILADSVGLALLVVLQALEPAERVAFVLHDMFDLPFEEIAPIVGRTPAAARQLASRARRRVQGKPVAPSADFTRNFTRRRKIVDAFLAASRGGDFEALLTLLDPNVVFRADPAAVKLGSLAEIRGAEAVAATFKGRAMGARPALVDGALGIVVAFHGQLRIVLEPTIAGGRITAITAIADPERLAGLDFKILDD